MDLDGRRAVLQSSALRSPARTWKELALLAQISRSATRFSVSATPVPARAVGAVAGNGRVLRPARLPCRWSARRVPRRRAPVGRRSRRPCALLKWTRARTRMAPCVGNTRRLRVRGVAWRLGSGGPEEAAARGPAASLRRHCAPARTIGTASG
jgi:hypothetical protein